MKLPITEELKQRIASIYKTDIRDPDDEMVAFGLIHIEAMSENSWWIGIYTVDGRLIHVNLWNKTRARIYSRMEDQGVENEYAASLLSHCLPEADGRRLDAIRRIQELRMWMLTKDGCKVCGGKFEYLSEPENHLQFYDEPCPIRPIETPLNNSAA